jgi:hypothetical protein
MSATHANRSIPEVFSDLVGQLTTLFRKEAELARTEVSEKVSKIAVGFGLAMVGGVLVIPALVVLLGAIVSALISNGLPVFLASVLVGGSTLVIGIFLMISGIGRLKAESLVPEKTLHQLQRDVEVAKNEMSDDHGLNRAA